MEEAQSVSRRSDVVVLKLDRHPGNRCEVGPLLPFEPFHPAATAAACEADSPLCICSLRRSRRASMLRCFTVRAATGYRPPCGQAEAHGSALAGGEEDNVVGSSR